MEETEDLSEIIKKELDIDNDNSLKNIKGKGKEVIWDLDFFNFDYFPEIYLSNFKIIACKIDRRENSFFKKNKIHFSKCTFDTPLILLNIELDLLSFTSCIFNYRVSLGGKINRLNFSSFPKEEKGFPSLEFGNIEINYFKLHNIKTKNKILFGLENSKIHNSLSINHCEIEYIRLADLTINNTYITNNKNTSLTILFSTFNKNVEINNNDFSKLNFDRSYFYSHTSIQKNTVNTIQFNNVQFNDRTYFDDFKVLEPTKCDKITHRIIKQELQKTENRIDFDKFRSYELEAYKKELKQTEKWYHGDLLILQLNSLFSKHGTSWGRSLFMTILFSFFFFTCLYAVKRFQNQIGICQMNCDHYLSSYFRFSLITNFYDPIPKSRDIKYLQTFWEWVPFIFGKITIGYGLFETVQSFRKYKK